MAFNQVTIPQSPAPVPVNQGDPVGGSCVGSTFPNPVIAPGAVGNNQIASNAIDSSKIQTGSLTATLFASGINFLPITDPSQINSGVILDANISTTAGIQTIKLAEGLLFINNYADVIISGVKTLWHGQTSYFPVVSYDIANKMYVDDKVNSGIGSGGGSGNVSGSGTIGFLAKFSPTGATVANSILQESAGNITINGQLLSNIGSISGNDIISQSILNGHLANLSISNNKLQQACISGNVIAANSILNGDIATNSIANNQLQSAAVSGNAIAANSILTGMLTPNLVSTSNLQVGSISGNVIGFGAILNGDIALNSIANNQLQSASVSGGVVATQSILNGMYAPNSIDNSKLQSASISGNVIAQPAIGGPNIAGYPNDATKFYNGQGNWAIPNSLSNQVVSGNNVAQPGIQQGNVLSGYVDLATNQIISGTKEFYNSIFLGPLNGSLWSTDQNGSLSLGGNCSGYPIPQIGGQQPYIDFHFGGGVQKTYDARIQNTGNNQLTVSTGSGTAFTVTPTGVTFSVPVLGNNIIGTNQLQVGSISGNVIGFGAILNGDIALNSIANNQLQSASVSGNVIGNGAILTGMIGNNVLTNAQHQSASISGGVIATQSLLNGMYAPNSIDNSKLQSASISGNVIATQSILNGMIATNTIATNQLQVGSVSGNVIGFGAILNGDIALNSIANNQLESASVSGNVIAANSILEGHLSPNSIKNSYLESGSVSGNAIDINSRTIDVLMNNTYVATEKRLNFLQGGNTTLTIADNSANNRVDILVSSASGTSNSITNAMLESGSVSGNAIATPGISQGHILSGYVDLQTNQIVSGTKLFYNNMTFGPPNGSMFYTFDQNGSLSLGGNTSGLPVPQIGGQQPYIDFHFGGGVQKTYDVRIQNTGNNQLTVSTGSGTAFTVTPTGVTFSVPILGNNIIGTNQLQVGSISGNVIGFGAILNGDIALNSIANNQLQSAAVSGNAIASNSILEGHLSPNSIKNSYLESGSVSGNAIGNGAILTGMIANNSITNTMLESASVSGGVIATQSILNGMYAPNSIDNSKLQSASISGNVIAQPAIGGPNIAGYPNDNTKFFNGAGLWSVPTSSVANNSITNAMLESASVSGGVIATQSILNGMYAPNSIDNSKLQSASISGNVIATQSIAQGHVLSGYVDLATNQIISGTKEFYNSIFLGPLNGSLWSTDQNGSLSLGGNCSGYPIPQIGGQKPYLDFHFGGGVQKTYDARIQNTGNNQLTVSTGSGTAFTVTPTGVTFSVPVLGNNIISSNQLQVGSISGNVIAQPAIGGPNIQGYPTNIGASYQDYTLYYNGSGCFATCPDPIDGYTLLDDFVGQIATTISGVGVLNLGQTPGRSGGSATNYAYVDTSSPGVIQLNTAAAGDFIHIGVPSTQVGSYPLGLQAIVMTARVQLFSNTGGSNDQGQFRIGFVSPGWNRGASVVGTTRRPNDGIFFEFDTVNNTTWQCVSIKNGTATVVDSSVTLTLAQWYQLKIVVFTGPGLNPFGQNNPSACFYIDNVGPTDITTNIPSNTTTVSPFVNLAQNVHVVAGFQAYVDYIGTTVKFAGRPRNGQVWNNY